MAKQRDDSEVLKTIIAKSTNKSAVAAAQNELGALQQRKASIAAAIQPALDVPQIVAQPTSKGVQLGDQDSSNDLKAIRKDMSQMLGEAKKSRTLLESILKTNQKYYESNSELINRLMMATGLSQEQIEALAKKQKAGAGQTGGAGAGGIGSDEDESKSGSGGLLGGLLSGGLAGLLGSRFGKKPPAGDTPDGKKPPKDAKPSKDKKNKSNKGRLGKLLGLAALLSGGLVGYDFLTNDDPNAAEQKLDDLVPDGLAEVAPDAALAVGLQAPTIASALRSGPTPPASPTPDDKPPPKKQAKPPTSSTPDDKPPPKKQTKPPAKPAAAPPKSPPNGVSPAQQIWDDKIRGATKATEKEILEATAEKVGKSTLKSALKKIPVFGLLAGLGLGGYRYLWEGDSVGAGLEVGAGAAAIIPGVGTVGSVGIDVASLVRDIYASVYGTFPEEDAKVGERFDDLNATIMKYLNDTFGSSTPDQGSMGARAQYLANAKPAATTNTNAAAIAATTRAQTTTDISVNPNKSKAEYLTGAGSAPAPIQKMTPDKLNTIGNPAGAGPANIVINKQGDTITKVINGNAGGGGSSGVAGSPSRAPSPFDYLLYGDVFNWGY
jgi:hypothetical protein